MIAFHNNIVLKNGLVTGSEGNYSVGAVTSGDSYGDFEKVINENVSVINLSSNLGLNNTNDIIDKCNFEFKDNAITNGTYFIKEMNFYMDAKIKTTKCIVNEENINIEYTLWLHDEEIGNFEFKLEVKE